MAVPLRALTVRTSLCTHKYSQVYSFQFTDAFVYRPIVCNLTNVCALASAHTSNLFVYMHISTNIDISYDGHFCIRTYGAETYIWVCLRERSQLELFVYMQILTSIHVSDHSTFCTNPLRANSHMSVPSRVLTLRTSFDTCKCLQIFIYRVMDTFVPEPTVRKLTYGCTLASAHS